MNKYEAHVYVIPEDDADRQLADGFVIHHDVKTRRIQVMPLAGGWHHVLRTFRDEYVPTLRNWPKAHVVMLIDFDDQGESRRDQFDAEIPEDVRDRAFVLGAKSDPETLKKSLKMSFEEIGTALAEECRARSSGMWNHDQLQHNEAERQRLFDTIRDFLF